MSFSTILFTEKGRALQAKAIAGAALTFTKIEMGSGSLGGQSQVTLSTLIDTEVILAINEIKRNSNYATVKGIFSNSDLSTGFFWREIGVFAQDPDLGEVLYCYGNAGALAEYIPPQTSEIIEKVVGLSVIVGNASSVSAVFNESMTLATKEDISLMDQRVDAVEIPIFEDYETGTTAPTPEVALPNIKKAVGLPVILQYIKAFLKGTVTLAKISNNLVTTASGLVLDARQGTALKARIDALNDNLVEFLKSQSGAINSSTNWDTISQGMYPVIDTTGLNAPPVSYPYGLVLVTDTVGVFAVRLEIYFPHVAEAYPVYRVRFDGNWLAWKSFAA